MAQDARLDLGRYVQNPFNRQGRIKSQLNFDELFRSKPDTGAYPWNPSRFTEEDLLKRMMTRKVNLNPRLNFLSNSPFFDDNTAVNQKYELFEGLGRFDRLRDYNFNDGRPNTTQRPEDQPDYNPMWMEAYRLSPTLEPGDVSKNPMPRLRNPDPKGILMAAAQEQVDAEAQGDVSVEQILQAQGKVSPSKLATEEKIGGEVIKQDEMETNISPGKTTK